MRDNGLKKVRIVKTIDDNYKSGLNCKAMGKGVRQGQICIMVDLCAVFWGRSITRRRVAQKELKSSQKGYICYLSLKVNIRFRNTDQKNPGIPEN